jgi:phosphoribosylaminoimidazole-succinocarboxamide synthase
VKTNIPGAKKLFSGKVRDVYSVDDAHLLIVATDRISAFDYVFPNGIPAKGCFSIQSPTSGFQISSL